jgi:hypothetical protein
MALLQEAKVRAGDVQSEFGLDIRYWSRLRHEKRFQFVICPVIMKSIVSMGDFHPLPPSG